MFRVILYQEVIESRSLYVHIYIFMSLFLKRIFPTIIWDQKLQSNINNLHIVMWFQVTD